MNKTVKTSLVLFLICAVCAILCALVNSITAPIIEENVRKANALALQSVAGDLEIGETASVTGNSYVEEETPLFKNGERMGSALLLSGSGYGGKLSIIAAYDNSGALIGAKMTTNSETAGLGKKAEEDWYMELFQGMTEFPSSPKDLGGDDASLVSGATLTFKGVTNALREGSLYVKEGKR